MLQHFFKLAWRNLSKNRQFSFLNLIGLSTGLACAILVYLWVSDELSVNTFNENDERIYQVMQSITEGDGAIENTPGLLADALSREMPEVERAAAFIPSSWFPDKGLFSFGRTRIRAGVEFVGNDYFNIFPCRFTEGNKGQLFAGKNNIAISGELALKLFGSTSGVTGKTIEWKQKDFSGNYIVAGVFEKFPANSTIQLDAVLNYALFLEKNPKLLKWGNNDPYTYLLLKKGTDVDAFNKKIAGFVKSKLAASKEVLFVQRFSDTYLYNRYNNGVPSGGRIEYVKLFSVISIFILAIACINFMNLSTAKAVMRMKKVSIQKIVGASRRSLMLQYFSETLLMVFLSLLVAIAIVIILLPAFENIAKKDLYIRFDAGFILGITGISLITAFIAGSYPAVYLSGFKPAIILKGKLSNAISETWVRKGLVVFQFAVSAVLIVSVLVAYRQMQLIQTAHLGYDRHQVIYFDRGGELPDKEKGLETFIQEVKAIPGVVNASNFRHGIVNRDGGTTDITWQGKSPDDKTPFTDIACGYNFIETMGIQLKEGRSYSTAFGSDNDKVVLNEAAVKAMQLANPVGKTVMIWGEKKQIIGITKDFHFQSLHERIKPCFFDLNMNQRVSKIAVKLEAGNEKAAIDRISAFYKNYTGEALDYTFLDNDYLALYVSEQRVAVLAAYFAGMAIVVSCLGLFGLTAFTAQKRQKEISIRKIMGASVSHIAAMLSKDFLMLICLALLIACPCAWWIASHWLQSFAYRIHIGSSVFILAALAVILIALLTVSFQSIKAALANPAGSLKNE